jgi:hypothetical protein
MREQKYDKQIELTCGESREYQFADDKFNIIRHDVQAPCSRYDDTKGIFIG